MDGKNTGGDDEHVCAGAPQVIAADTEVLILDKPRGWEVHPRAAAPAACSIAAWVVREGIVSPMVGNLHPDPERRASVLRPGVVHRLDRDTTGVLALARTQEAWHMLTTQFASRTVRKAYLALVWGRLPSLRGSVRYAIGRHAVQPTKRRAIRAPLLSPTQTRPAHTEWALLEEGELAGHLVSLVAVTPRTGRTHQIRVHMEAIGRPIVGDTRYRRGAPPFTAMFPLALHAARLTIALPHRQQPHTFTASLPPDWPRGVWCERAAAYIATGEVVW